MSEIINNSEQRKELLKHLLLRLHDGETVDSLRDRLISTLSKIPYNDVVEVEQELINTNMLSESDVLKFCDLHSAVLNGAIDLEHTKPVPAGHPIDTFKKENEALKNEVNKIHLLIENQQQQSTETVHDYIVSLRSCFNMLCDVDKHYKRKEYLLFPYLEKHAITGPPKVMWGKHDETRQMLKNTIEALVSSQIRVEDLPAITDFLIKPTLEQFLGMIMKEEEILFPMSMDILTHDEWVKIYHETPEFGYCIVDPQDEWNDAGKLSENSLEYIHTDSIRLSSGAFSMKELEALFLHLPIDITFVDANDKVGFFSHSPNRVFERNRSIIGRDVRMCHPPGSVHIVEQIISDFKNGKENRAMFWISNFKGRFIVIDYTAVRGKNGEYLGVVEVTQDITKYRQLEGDQRLLSYEKNNYE